MADAFADICAGVPDYVYGERQTVHRDASGNWRRELVHVDPDRTGARNSPAEQRERHDGVRAAKSRGRPLMNHEAVERRQQEGPERIGNATSFTTDACRKI